MKHLPTKLLMMLALAGPVLALAAPGAGEPFDCSMLYSLGIAGQITSVNPATIGVSPTITETNVVDISPAASSNGLAISADGRFAYAITRDFSTPPNPRVVRYDAITQTTTLVTIPDGERGSPSGAINPVNGIYYYGFNNFNTSGARDVMAFDINTNTRIGVVGVLAITLPGTGSGDYAFDAAGNFYVISDANLYVVPAGTLPTTASAAVIPVRRLVTGPNTVAFDGIAFSPSGQLYVQSVNQLINLNPNTGAQIGVATTKPTGGTDLASCARPPSMQVRKNIVSRFAASDQFSLSSSIATAATGVTTGNTLGVQPQIIGPNVVSKGTAYTFGETAASGSLANYVPTYSCIDSANGNTVVSSGVGSSGAVAIPVSAVNPSNIVCTISNAVAPPPTVQISKLSVGGIGSFGFGLTGVSGATDSVTTTSAGSAVTSPAPVHVGTAGTAVTINETSGTAGYTTAVSCVDANSASTGNTTPINSSTTAATIPAVNMKVGALYTCSYTNTKSPTLSLQKALGGSGRIAAADQFSLSGTGTGAPAAQATSGTGTAVTSPAYSIIGTPGTAYSLTEAMAAGSTSSLASYGQTVACTNSGSTVVTGFTTLPINVTPAAGDAITCTVTNSPRTASLQLAKAWGASSVASDTANIGATSGGSSNTVAFGTAGGTPANSGAAVTVTLGNTITLPAETFTPSARAANYTSTLACTAAGGATANPLSGTNGKLVNTLLIGAGDIGKTIVCTYTNTLVVANLSVVKTANPTNVRTGGTVVFTLTVNNGGPAAANGSILRDKPGPGFSCTAAPTCVASGGASCPSAAALTAPALLSNAGVPIPVLPAGGQAVVTLTCVATASGQ